MEGQVLRTGIAGTDCYSSTLRTWLVLPCQKQSLLYLIYTSRELYSMRRSKDRVPDPLHTRCVMYVLLIRRHAHVAYTRCCGSVMNVIALAYSTHTYMQDVDSTIQVVAAVTDALLLICGRLRYCSSSRCKSGSWAILTAWIVLSIFVISCFRIMSCVSSSLIAWHIWLAHWYN